MLIKHYVRDYERGKEGKNEFKNVSNADKFM